VLPGFQNGKCLWDYELNLHLSRELNGISGRERMPKMAYHITLVTNNSNMSIAITNPAYEGDSMLVGPAPANNPGSAPAATPTRPIARSSSIRYREIPRTPTPSERQTTSTPLPIITVSGTIRTARSTALGKREPTRLHLTHRPATFKSRSSRTGRSRSQKPVLRRRPVQARAAPNEVAPALEPSILQGWGRSGEIVD
jgi:hypothetical protein